MIAYSASIGIFRLTVYLKVEQCSY